MTGRGLAIAALVGGPVFGATAVGAYAFGRWWGGLVQRLLDTPIGERQRRAANPNFEDVTR